MKRPILLLLSELHRPIDLLRARLGEIEGCIVRQPPQAVTLQGLFALAISSFETMLADVYRYYVEQVPPAFDFSEAKISRTAILSAPTPTALLAEQIDRQVMTLAYERFSKFLGTVSEALSIAAPPFDTDLIDRIVEAKETRNLLLHNNLSVNRSYLSKAGPKRRSECLKQELPLTADYVEKTLADLHSLSNEIGTRIQAKFGKYTRVRAVRELWDYLFRSPIMKFDDYWIVDEKKDGIYAIKTSALDGQLSTSEKMFLDVLRSHVSYPPHAAAPINMLLLDGEHHHRLLYLLDLLGSFRLC